MGRRRPILSYKLSIGETCRSGGRAGHSSAATFITCPGFPSNRIIVWIHRQLASHYIGANTREENHIRAPKGNANTKPPGLRQQNSSNNISSVKYGRLLGTNSKILSELLYSNKPYVQTTLFRDMHLTF